jgi:hypothetical protein
VGRVLCGIQQNHALEISHCGREVTEEEMAVAATGVKRNIARCGGQGLVQHGDLRRESRKHRRSFSLGDGWLASAGCDGCDGCDQQEESGDTVHDGNSGETRRNAEQENQAPSSACRSQNFLNNDATELRFPR